MKLRIAICSPNKNAYSETFIMAQKNGLMGKIFYYFGGLLPNELEGHGKLSNRYTEVSNIVKRKIKTTTFNSEEEAFISSLKKNKIQVVLAQYGVTAHRIVDICKHLKIPLVTHFHGYDASMHSFIESCGNYKKVFDYSAAVIAVSQTMKERLLQIGCPANKLVYNPYGPNDSFLALKPEFLTESFIGVGRFVDKKAPYYIILSFQKVLSKYPDAKLILGGDGPLFEVCHNLVKYLKIEQSVILPGPVSREKFIDYLASARAFVQHSVTAISGDQEGTPVAILEASAAGLPVISTRHAGIKDVVLEGETGYLVNEHDVDGMAEKMLMLLSNKELAVRLGKNGKERINKHFSLKQHLDRLDDIIAQAVK
jgi:colanic acid/amylovoran biosynthesis glycosyltransferase